MLLGLHSISNFINFFKMFSSLNYFQMNYNILSGQTLMFAVYITQVYNKAPNENKPYIWNMSESLDLSALTICCRCKTVTFTIFIFFGQCLQMNNPDSKILTCPAEFHALCQ